MAARRSHRAHQVRGGSGHGGVEQRRSPPTGQTGLHARMRSVPRPERGEAVFSTGATLSGRWRRARVRAANYAGSVAGAIDVADVNGDPRQLPAVLQAAPAAVLMIDPRERQVVYANTAAIELTGERVRLPVDIDSVERRRGPHRSRRSADERHRFAAVVRRGGRARGGRAGGRARRGPARLVGDQPASGRPARAGCSGSPASCCPTRTALGLDRACAGGVPAALGHRAGASAAASRCCATAPSSPPRCRSRSPTRAARTTRWSGSTRPSPGSPGTARPRSSAATAGSCRATATDRAADRPDRRGAARPRADHRGAAQLPPRRHGLLEPGVDLARCSTATGELVNFVGVQNDVTERVIVEQERRAALAEAEEARGVAAAARRGDHPDDGGARRRPTPAPGWRASSCPHLADLCAVDLLDRPGEGIARRVAVAARDPADEELLRRAGAGAALPRRAARAPPARCSAGGDPVLLPELPDAGADRYPDDRRGRGRVRPAPAALGDGRAPAGPRAGARRAHALHPAPLRVAATPRATCTWPPISPDGRASPSTTPGSTRPSTPR